MSHATRHVATLKKKRLCADDYFQEASDGVDAVFIEWEGNPWLDVRCIASGHWTYRVDFNTMTQQVKNTAMSLLFSAGFGRF